MRSPIVVVGSLNIDLVVRTNRIPKPGETVLGSTVETFCGGKGANQAVAASRQGADVRFVGCVGEDENGRRAVLALENERIDTSCVFVEPKTSTGTAFITVEDSGQNNIVVVPGANALLSAKHLSNARNVFNGCTFVVLQFESPMEVVLEAAKLARAGNVRVVLNPAPAQTISKELLQTVDLLVLNETELEIISEKKLSTLSEQKTEIETLHRKGISTVVLTLGSEGVVAYSEKTNWIELPSYRVDVVDTTAAGDSFLGALVVALSENQSLENALKNACAAGALAVTKAGAQNSIPTRSEVEFFLEQISGEPG